MKNIMPTELRQWMTEGRDFVLVDVRELWERTSYNIGGMHIPMGVLIERRNELPEDKTVVLYCEKGIRSTIAIQRLETMGYDNLWNLSGGMSSWKMTASGR